MKLYYPHNHYDPAFHRHVFPLLKAFIKDEGFTDVHRVAMYGISEQELIFVDALEQADIAILPMSWNYYVKENRKNEAIDYITKANNLNKTTWMVLLGDVGLPIPEFSNTVLFRASGYRTKLPIWHQGLPVFISDPVKAIFKTDEIELHAYSDRPVVGFCGLASSNKWDAIKIISKIAIKNLLYHLKLYPETPEALIAAPFFRFQCLKLLMKNQNIDSNFIIRAHYRAGADTREARWQSTLEFYNNIQDSDYVLCVRGAGNFSVRLYETLAMGRIPIYVNTDGLLPLSDKMDWQKHVVWIEQHEISDIAEKVITFHKNLDQEKLQTLFISNRGLWKNYLRTGTFFKTYGT